MKRIVLIALALLTFAAHADTPPLRQVNAELFDSVGNGITSTVTGGKRGIDSNITNPITATVTSSAGSPVIVESAFGGLLLDPRQIRLLTTSDQVTSFQGGAWSTTVTNAFALDSTLSALLAKFNSLGQKLMSASAPVVIASDQSSIPVAVSSVPLPPNAAQETGGHLASIDTKIPASPSQEHTTAASPNSCRLSDGAAFYIGFKSGDSIGNTSFTANAGTNLNTSLLALESGGHLASIDTKLTSPLVTNATLQAGSAIVGKVGIDQTTPGTTNGVQVNAALPTGTNSIGQVTANAGTNLNTSALFTSSNATAGSAKFQSVDGSGNVVGPVQTIAGTNYMPVFTASSGTTGSAVPARTQMIGGSDGTNLRTWFIDALGIGQVDLGNTNKSVVMKTGSLVTTATTANQVVLTYTTTTGKTFYLEYFDCVVILTGAAATQTSFGTCSLSINGTIVYTQNLKGPGSDYPNTVHLGEPIPVLSTQIILIETTPGAVTSYTWNGNFGGYEK